jgi:hypothetical protein
MNGEHIPEVDLARGPGGEMQSTQHFYSTRHSEFAKLLDENPPLSDVVMKVMEAMMRIVEDNHINTRHQGFKPTTGLYRGRIVIDLGIPGL